MPIPPPPEFADFERVQIPQPTDTVCKHKTGSCEKCGSTDRRDTWHKTVGGRGKVGQAIARSKKKK